MLDIGRFINGGGMLEGGKNEWGRGAKVGERQAKEKGEGEPPDNRRSPHLTDADMIRKRRELSKIAACSESFYVAKPSLRTFVLPAS